MNRKYIAIIAVVALVALAGCANQTTGSDEGEQLAEDTGEDISEVEQGASYAYEVGLTEKNQYGLVQAQPAEVMEHSLERENLIKRYDYLNDRSNEHHVYMLSNDGDVINYEVAQGKVSSVNSKLTNDQQIVGSDQCVREAHSQSEGSCFTTVESPQMDGSYGSNGDAIFFFTPQGHYVEYNGIYVVSEEPKNIQSPVTLVDIVEDEGNSVDSTSDGNTTEAGA